MRPQLAQVPGKVADTRIDSPVANVHLRLKRLDAGIALCA
ncbi:hypothetical protein ES703_79822 [subsurface metagenome]